MNRLFASLAVALLLVPSTGCIVDARGEGAQGSFERTMTVSGPVTLELETGSGEVVVSTSETGTVNVRGRVSAGARFWDGQDAGDRVRRVEQNPPIEQTGNDIHIGRWPKYNNVSISYLVSVPRETSLRLRTGSGDVRVSDLRGPVTATTGSGWIRLGHIDSEVRARTGSGDVELEQGDKSISISTGSGRVLVRAAGDGSSEVSTGSGDVEFNGASGPLRVRTGSGRIEVTGSPKGEWELGAGSGDLSIQVPSDAAFTVDLRSSSGDIDARSVVQTGDGDDRRGRRERRELRGVVGAGGPLVSMSTGSGEIRIR